MTRDRRNNADIAGMLPLPRFTALLAGLLTGVWMSTAGVAGDSDRTTGDTCRLDQDCNGYLRCLARVCTVPPAVLGRGDVETASVDIVADGESRGRFLVELATDSFAWGRGLSLRPSMAPHWGMLFVFPRSVHHSFTMRLMRFPLDIVFIDDLGKVVDIIADAQPKTPVLVPASKYRYALELTAGATHSRGIRVGDTVQLYRVPKHEISNADLLPLR